MVVLTLYSFYIHEKDHAQYDLGESSVYSREIFNMLLVSQVSGLVETEIGILLRHHKCDKCQTLHDSITH